MTLYIYLFPSYSVSNLKRKEILPRHTEGVQSTAWGRLVPWAHSSLAQDRNHLLALSPASTCCWWCLRKKDTMECTLCGILFRGDRMWGRKGTKSCPYVVPTHASTIHFTFVKSFSMTVLRSSVSLNPYLMNSFALKASVRSIEKVLMEFKR